MARSRLLFVKITAESNIRKNAFVVDSFELVSQSGRSLFPYGESLRHVCSGDRCIIDGTVFTGIALDKLSFKALYVYLPLESRDLIICKNPELENEIGFQNNYLSVESVCISDSEYVFEI